VWGRGGFPDFDLSLLEGVRDSKQMSELGREIWYEKLRVLKGEGLRHRVGFASAKYIDKFGIVPAIRSAMASALRLLELDPAACHVVLDGSLYAPEKFISQETIIRGDQSEPIISIASVAAKVKRDHLMKNLRSNTRNITSKCIKGMGQNCTMKLSPNLALRYPPQNIL
jgi:ribonuclease HII